MDEDLYVATEAVMKAFRGTHSSKQFFLQSWTQWKDHKFLELSIFMCVFEREREEGEGMERGSKHRQSRQGTRFWEKKRKSPL